MDLVDTLENVGLSITKSPIFVYLASVSRAV